MRQHRYARVQAQRSHGGVGVVQRQRWQVPPRLPCVGAAGSAHLAPAAVVSHQRHPLSGRAHEHAGLQPRVVGGQALHTHKFALRPKAGGHRVFDAQLEVQRQQHAAAFQGQRRIAYQMAGVPQPRQRQHPHRLKTHRLQRRARHLPQMRHTPSRPAAQACSHHKQMHYTLLVQPGHGVAQAAHAVAQLLTQFSTVNHETRCLPLLRRAVKGRHRDLHVGRTLSLACKPKRQQAGWGIGWHGQQAAGMGSRRACWHGNAAARDNAQGVAANGIRSHGPHSSRRRRNADGLHTALHPVADTDGDADARHGQQAPNLCTSRRRWGWHRIWHSGAGD